MTKRMSKKDAVLEALSCGKPVHMRDLNAITFRYGGRIHELRHEDGYDIRTIRLAEDEFAYQLMHKPKQMALI
jgi:glycosyltransferase involved in cell wall biosynthesis